MSKLELNSEELCATYDCSTFTFQSTAEVSPLEGIIGQERAVSSLEFGLKINKQGYNIFIVGMTGTGRSSYTKSLVNRVAPREKKPNDWCYLYNFNNPDQPKAVSFATGSIVEFQEDIKELLSKVELEIPKVLNSEEFQKAKTIILQKLQDKQSEVHTLINKKAKELGFALKSADNGLVTIPLNNEGKPMEEEEYENLDININEELEVKSKELNLLIIEAFKKLHEYETEIETEVDKLEYDIILNRIGDYFNCLIKKYSTNVFAVEHLNNILQDILGNIKRFKEKEHKAEIEIEQILLKDTRPRDNFQNYKVNVLIDNSKLTGAPVVIEDNPTYYNLMGRVEYENKLGVLTTEFTKIKAGSLHQANGGYLILRCRDVLTNNLCWNALKRALKTKKMQIESIGDQMGLIASSSLKPEPIPLNVKVIMIGSSYEYQMLYEYDEDFRKLFKIMVDFDVEMDRTQEHAYKLSRFIRDHCEREKLRHFTRDAVGKIVEYSSRLANSQDKLSTRFNELVEIIYEADTWASLEDNDLVTAVDVKKAIKEKVYRSNKYEMKLQRMIEKGIILIDTDKKVVGQVNGLAVLDTGEYAFGKPSRITVNTYLGNKGIINIEREVKMSGAVHNKGVLILSGYMGEKFGNSFPLSFSASICFEQLYNGVDGDSASSSELYALLSSLSGIPIDQGIAVTGSVNQKGFIQPIGGVDQKIEGFYQVCKAKGLTGTQGVIIPRQNKDDLMLNDEVITAVKEGNFHIYVVETVEEGIEILTGVSAGIVDNRGRYPRNSVFDKVQEKLKKFYNIVKKDENVTEKNNNMTKKEDTALKNGKKK
ncbi:MAG: ATP-binding protein [Clostridia bacterium]|nr:ATP-binding protein [Clostridia bacterium]